MTRKRRDFVGEVRNPKSTGLYAAVFLLTFPATLAAQQTLSQPAFEVASVKRNQSGDTRVSQGLQPGGRYVAVNILLRTLIMRAYRLLEFHLAGGPDWISTERYDIVGLAPGATTSDDITPRLQSLLADRFKLTTHMEKREMPVLWLVLANKDGRLGPKLHRSTADCPLLPPAGAAPPPVCIMRLTRASLTTGGSPMIAFLNVFSQITGKLWSIGRGSLDSSRPTSSGLPTRLLPAHPKLSSLMIPTGRRSPRRFGSNWGSGWRTEETPSTCW